MSNRPPVHVKFIGGAQEQYNSFKDLATAALDMFSKEWKNYGHPKSYIFPPVFSYDMPDVSDQAIDETEKKAQEKDESTAEAHEIGSTCQKEKKTFEKTNHGQERSTSEAQESRSTCPKKRKDFKKTNQEQERSSAEAKGSGSTSQKLDSLPQKCSFFAGLRVGDKAENIVYDALEAVSQLACISPMVIINNFDLNRIKVSDKASIFPNGDKLCGEYDFVTIGPKVGIVVIEVKNAHKSKSGSQLHLFDNVIEFLTQEHSTVSLSDEYVVRKLRIITSSTKPSHKKKPGIGQENQKNPDVNDECPKDMGRKRQEKEVTSAESEIKSSSTNSKQDDSPPESAKNVPIKAEHRCWDQGDIKNRANHKSKPGFYTKFFDFFQETGYSMSRESYESFAPILVGLASFLTFKTSSRSADLKLDLLKISEAAVFTVDTVRLQRQNPKKVNPITKLENVRDFNIVLLPTPDQQRALEPSSSDRKFIIGVAGTGKTVVLQQKALKMLQEGKKVLVLTASSYMEEFKKFLEINCRDHNVNSITVDCWSGKTKFLKEFFKVGCFISSHCARLSLEQENGGKNDPILTFKNWVKELLEDEELTIIDPFLDMFDGILIDDACDQVDRTSEDRGETETNTFSRFNNLCTAVTCLAVFEMIHPSKTLWIALDLVLPPLGNGWTIMYMQYRSLHSQVMKRLLSNSKDRIHEYPFDTVVLNHIMRHSENIFKFSYTMDVLSQMILRPIMGHKIVGKVATKVSFFSTSLHKRRDYGAIWIEVKKVLDQIQSAQIPLNFVCVLIGGEWPDDKGLLEKFKTKCIDCSIQTTNTEAIKAENEAFQSNSYGESRARDKEALFMDFWYNVSSREWPIVIFCAISNRSTWKDEHAIQRYRAYSRAIVKLYQILVRYPALDEPEISQDDLTRTFGNNGPSRQPTLRRRKTFHSFGLQTHRSPTRADSHWFQYLIRNYRTVRRQKYLDMQTSDHFYSTPDNWFSSF